MIYLDTSVALAHLLAEDRAPMDFLRRQGARPRLASYDQRLIEAARALEFPIHPV